MNQTVLEYIYTRDYAVQTVSHRIMGKQQARAFLSLYATQVGRQRALTPSGFVSAIAFSLLKFNLKPVDHARFMYLVFKEMDISTNIRSDHEISSSTLQQQNSSDSNEDLRSIQAAPISRRPTVKQQQQMRQDKELRHQRLEQFIDDSSFFTDFDSVSHLPAHLPTPVMQSSDQLVSTETSHTPPLVSTVSPCTEYKDPDTAQSIDTVDGNNVVTCHSGDVDSTAAAQPSTSRRRRRKRTSELSGAKPAKLEHTEDKCLDTTIAEEASVKTDKTVKTENQRMRKRLDKIKESRLTESDTLFLNCMMQAAYNEKLFLNLSNKIFYEKVQELRIPDRRPYRERTTKALEKLSDKLNEFVNDAVSSSDET